MRDTPDPIPISPGEILERILDPNEEKTPEEWVCADEITRLTARVKELEGVLADAGRVLDWAARKMKGNCAGHDINTVMMAAGRTAEARTAITKESAALSQPAPEKGE